MSNVHAKKGRRCSLCGRGGKVLGPIMLQLDNGERACLACVEQRGERPKLSQMRDRGSS